MEAFGHHGPIIGDYTGATVMVARLGSNTNIVDGPILLCYTNDSFSLGGSKHCYLNSLLQVLTGKMLLSSLMKAVFL